MASHLQRFKDAQEQPISGFESALSEIRAGGKRSHWIWYVFPQLSGLGQSPASLTYGVRGISEAREYLRDALLRSRFLAVASAVAEQIGPRRQVSLRRLMGSTIARGLPWPERPGGPPWPFQACGMFANGSSGLVGERSSSG